LIGFLRELLHDHPAIEAELDLGHMPEEIKGLLDRNGLALFPTKWSDIEARCSCPDWANPCKHLAAVYYLIAREIDLDPFVLFTLRGVDPASIRREGRNGGREKKRLGKRDVEGAPGQVVRFATDPEIKRLIRSFSVYFPALPSVCFEASPLYPRLRMVPMGASAFATCPTFTRDQ
jgi:uncharacterized Zn finger protein